MINVKILEHVRSMQTLQNVDLVCRKKTTKRKMKKVWFLKLFT